MRFFVLILGISILFLTPVFGKNLLKNPGMEQSDTESTYWRLDQYTNGGSVVKIEKGIAHTGNNSVSIENIQQNDARLMQDVTVKPGTSYKISGWIKTENISTEGLGANLSFNDHWFTTEEIEGTQEEWKYVECYLVVQDNITTMTLCLRVGGYGGVSTGKAYFDDIMMEEVKNAPGGDRTFTVGGSNNKSKKDDNRNSSKKTQPDTFQQEEPPMDPDTFRSMVIVYSLIACSIIVFCLQLILVKNENKE